MSDATTRKAVVSNLLAGGLALCLQTLQELCIEFSQDVDARCALEQLTRSIYCASIQAAVVQQPTLCFT